MGCGLWRGSRAAEWAIACWWAKGRKWTRAFGCHSRKKGAGTPRREGSGGQAAACGQQIGDASDMKRTEGNRRAPVRNGPALEEGLHSLDHAGLSVVVSLCNPRIQVEVGGASPEPVTRT